MTTISVGGCKVVLGTKLGNILMMNMQMDAIDGFFTLQSCDDAVEIAECISYTTKSFLIGTSLGRIIELDMSG